jgi:hypothetical protein
MITALTPKYYKAFTVALLILVVATAHIFIVSILIELGKSTSTNLQENPWLSVAEAISWNNPEVYESQARYYRRQAFIVDGAINRQNAAQDLSLRTSLKYWLRAVDASPLWPYYQLGALDIEVLLNRPEGVIQGRLDSVIELGANERGLEKDMFKISFVAWRKLSTGQKETVLGRLKNRSNRMLKAVFEVAKAAGTHNAICVNLPWRKVRHLCR